MRTHTKRVCRNGQQSLAHCSRSPTKRRHERWVVPGGNVSGGRNLALAPLRHRVFSCKFLMQFGLDVHGRSARFLESADVARKVGAPRTRFEILKLELALMG